jgi:hypothetical protein
MVTIAAVLLLATALRAMPILLSPRGLGIDHWYWKTYVDTYRRERRFPPSLPLYLLDEHQWYPPLFPLLLAKLPDMVFRRVESFIAVAIDLARMVMLLVFAYVNTGGDLTVVTMAGLLYATTPIQVSYNVQLNPRGLGALMLDALLILLLVQLDRGGPFWLWGVIAGLSGLIPLTHKMTTQLFWFLVAGTALVYRQAALLLVIPCSVALALLISRGFYWKVLRAHWDIVSFWNRNWRWIGADPVRESPVYGDPNYERPSKLHRKGVRGAVQQAVILFASNPAAWIGCLLVYERLSMQSPVLFFPTYLLVWLLLQCLFACATTFVTPLKCLGAGYLYLFNTSLITSLLLGTAFKQTLIPSMSRPFILLALACNIFALAAYFVHFYRNPRARVHEGLEQIIEALRAFPRGVVMCLPASWYEVVAYKTGHPVLWGGHGYGFEKLEPTWPRLLIPLREVLRRYDVRYLVTMSGVLPPQLAAELPAATCISCGDYRLYCFSDGVSAHDEETDTSEAVQAHAV